MNQFPQNPQNRIISLIAHFNRYLVVFQSMQSVKINLICLHFPLTAIYFVANQHTRNILDSLSQRFIPFSNVLVCSLCCDIKHQNSRISLNVINLLQSSLLFFTSNVPKMQLYWPIVGLKGELTNVDTLSRHMSFFELSCGILLDEIGLADSFISNYDHFKLFINLDYLVGPSPGARLLH